jgi:GNAT superfamily N-acetyltransferase
MTAQTPTKVTIRPFAPEDYAAAVSVSNAVYTEYANTVEEWRYTDEHRDPKCHFARFVAERDGAIVAIGECGQNAGMFHPRKFFIGVTVHPDWQGQGIGTSLYDHIVTSLEQFSPLSFRSNTREHWVHSLHFLAARGYEERMRSWESRLDVAAFDPTPYAGAEERTSACGIEIATYAGLAGDPGRDRKLYELDTALSRDVPHPEPMTPVSFEFYADRVFNDPDLLPDGWFVAIDRASAQYVGMCQLWNSQASDDLYNGLTGVLRSHRRRGIALALKLRGIAYAKALGRPTIKTWNEANNRAMLSINEALGFEKQPAWIDFVKVLRTEDETAPGHAGEAEG